MADEQVSFTSFVLIVVLGGLVIRYLFFPSTSATTTSGSPTRDSAAFARAAEASAERIQQMFPQLDRRTILWELHRNRGNVGLTTDRILAGRIETPPQTFQPIPPPGTSPRASSQPKVPTRPAEPDLITRYKLESKLSDNNTSETRASESSEPATSGSKTKAWSSNREERQAALQRRRDDMILAARRKMEAKLAAEKAAASGSGGI